MNEKSAKAGDAVRFICETRLHDGTVVQKCENPITKKIGTEESIKCLDNAIIGMSVGDEKTFNASAEDGYGNVDKSLVRTLPLEYFENNKIKPEIGARIRTINGECTISGISGNDVEVDYNHPLAGKI